MTEETLKALDSLRRAVAVQFGANPDEVEMLAIGAAEKHAHFALTFSSRFNTRPRL